MLNTSRIYSGQLLFLLYVNDLHKSSAKLSSRLFADDANIFYTEKHPKEIEKVMNEAFSEVLNYCNVNKLSANMKKKILRSFDH